MGLKSFIEMLLHSLWQAALLALLYTIVKVVFPRSHPLLRRNFLYGLLMSQLVISAITFSLLYTGFTFQTVESVLPLNVLSGIPTEYFFVAFVVYLCSVVIRSFSLIRSHSAFQRSFRESLRRPSADLKIFTDLKARHLGIKRKVALWYSDRFSVPLTYGFFKPVILLPFSLVNSISMQETEAIILHELAHIRSKDFLLNKFLIFVELIYLFNPFIRILATQIRLEREKNCDVQVINFEYPHWLYAETLLKIALNKTSPRGIYLGAYRRMPELIKRVRFFSREKSLLFRKNTFGFSIAACSPLLIAFACFFLQKPASLPAEKKFTVPATLSATSVANAFPAVEKVNKITTETIQEEPTVEAEATSPEMPIENLVDEDPDQFAIPAGFTRAADSVKEMIYDVETPAGKIRQVFRMELVNGQWIMQPQWMTIQTRPDSMLFDDSLYYKLAVDSIQ